MKYFLMLDYDGTLTPIVSRPELARLSSQRKKTLKLLARHPRIKLAIISGRKLAEVKRLIGLSRLIYVGNHGFEVEIGGKYSVHPAARRFVPILRKIKSALARKIKFKGVLVEDKGLTLSVHYRLVARSRQRLFKRSFYEAMAPWKGKVKITLGKKVLEIRPSLEWDKGRAVKWIIKRLGLKNYFPIYLGDDRTDEDAFKVLKGRGMAVWVGRRRSSRADFRLKDPDRVYSFFNYLLKGGVKDVSAFFGAK